MQSIKTITVIVMLTSVFLIHSSVNASISEDDAGSILVESQGTENHDSAPDPVINAASTPSMTAPLNIKQDNRQNSAPLSATNDDAVLHNGWVSTDQLLKLMEAHKPEQSPWAEVVKSVVSQSSAIVAALGFLVLILNDSLKNRRAFVEKESSKIRDTIATTRSNLSKVLASTRSNLPQCMDTIDALHTDRANLYTLGGHSGQASAEALGNCLDAASTQASIGDANVKLIDKGDVKKHYDKLEKEFHLWQNAIDEKISKLYKIPLMPTKWHSKKQKNTSPDPAE